MATLRLVVEYDGTDFVGWQRQANGRSVQEELERALHLALQEPVATVAAGRTDAGVHARGQIVSLRCEQEPDAEALRRSLNGLLPEAIVVHDVARVSDTFHARSSAIGRRYRYTICRGVTALSRKTSWQLFYDLDLAAMRACASDLLGEHDFASFCKANSGVAHYRCRVTRAEWTEDGCWLFFDVAANRFLYGMVRALVGTMIDAGRGRVDVGTFRRILEARDRAAAGMAAPASGLVLEEIIYPPSV